MTLNWVSHAPKGGPAPRRRRPLVPSDVAPSFAYGRKVRPSTPIGDVPHG